MSNVKLFKTNHGLGILFNDCSVFRVDYEPKNIYKFRGQQLSKMSSYSRGLNKNTKPMNFMLVGSCATGKTSVIREYFKQAEENYKNVKTVHIDCHADNTEFKVYSKILKKLNGGDGIGLQNKLQTSFQWIIFLVK